MDDLHVDSELTAVVIDDEDADGATAALEGLGEAGPEVGLVDDWEGLLDIASLGHGNDSAVVQVKDSVLLEDRAEQGLDNDGWGWVGDEGGLLVQLLGEQINTKEAVLASCWGSGDLDDLARTALEEDNITNADVVGWDSDCVWDASWRRYNTRSWTAGSGGNLDIYLWAAVTVDNTISGTVEAVAERVVVTILVVVTHLVVDDDLGRLDG